MIMTRRSCQFEQPLTSTGLRFFALPSTPRCRELGNVKCGAQGRGPPSISFSFLLCTDAAPFGVAVSTPSAPRRARLCAVPALSW